MGRAFQLHTENGATSASDAAIDRLLYLGITHQSASLCIRELLHTEKNIWQQISKTYSYHGASELLVLSTCDRFEIYVIDRQKSSDDWLATIARLFGLSPHFLSPYTKSLTGERAARHLLRVAAGMESRIIGEPHILSQLREAFNKAKKVGTVGATLSALCRSAIHTGKRVRKETNINRHRQSIVSLTIQNMKQTLRRGTPHRIAIVGTGTLATGFAAAMKDKANNLIVVSESIDRARTLANAAGASAWTRHEFLSQLPTIDAVVMCTTCSSYVLSREIIASSASDDLCIWDLSSPRSVEPSVNNLKGIKLTHLDELVQDLPVRQEELIACDVIVGQELSRLMDWSIHRRVAPKISRLIKSTHHQANQAGQVIDTRRLHHQIMRLKQEAAA